MQELVQRRSSGTGLQIARHVQPQKERLIACVRQKRFELRLYLIQIAPQPDLRRIIAVIPRREERLVDCYCLLYRPGLPKL